MCFVKSYFDHPTKRLIRQIRCRSLSEKKIVDTYPQVIVDVPKVSLNHNQLEYLSRNGKFKIILDENLNHTVLY